jgi:rod shape-determining protein MreB
VEGVRQVLEQTPPELSADIIDRGITLTGGGALLRGLPELLTEKTEIPAYVADSPLECVVLGTGKALDSLDVLKANGALLGTSRKRSRRG